MNTISKKAAAQLFEIAKECFDVETLETRNNDHDDFLDAAVWSIKEALERAYLLGRQSK